MILSTIITRRMALMYLINHVDKLIISNIKNVKGRLRLVTFANSVREVTFDKNEYSQFTFHMHSSASKRSTFDSCNYHRN